MSLNDCGLVRFQFAHTRAVDERQRVVEEAFTAKKRELETHAGHKLCPIKLAKRSPILEVVAAMPADLFKWMTSVPMSSAR